MQGRFNVVPERRPEKKDDGGNGPHTESPLENSSETVLAPRLMPIDNLQSNTTEKRGKVSKEYYWTVWKEQVNIAFKAFCDIGSPP